MRFLKAVIGSIYVAKPDGFWWDLRFFKFFKHGWFHLECLSKDIIAQEMSKCSKIESFEKQDVFFSKNSLKDFKRTKLANFFSSLRLRLSYCLRILKTFKNCVFGKTAGIFFKKCQQFSKDACLTNFMQNASQTVLLLKNSQKVQILGLSAKLNGCFWDNTW